MSDNAEQAKPQAHALGLSNTPDMTYTLIKHIEAIVDYLKIVFPFTYNEFLPEVMEYWDPVLDALYVDRETRVDMRRGGSNYEVGFHYHEDLFVFTGGESTKSNGTPTSMLEMRGMACRRFEERAVTAEENRLKRKLSESEKAAAKLGAWKNLFFVLSQLPHHCTRIDLTVDDFGGNIPVAELMAKCKKREFVSRIRKGFDTNGLPIDVETSVEEAIVREGLGWSFTLGMPDSERQLCIYNKKAEFENGNKGLVLSESVIRFESRFKSDRADFMLDELIKTVLTSADPLAFRRFVVGALASVIEFKEERKPGENTYKSRMWEPWAKFVEIGILPPKFTVKTPTKSIKRTGLWVKDDVSRAAFRLSATYLEEHGEIDVYLLREGAKRCNGDDLAMVNAAREAIGRKPYADASEMREAVTKAVEGIEIGKAVTDLFDERVEISLCPIEESSEKKEGEQ